MTVTNQLAAARAARHATAPAPTESMPSPTYVPAPAAPPAAPPVQVSPGGFDPRFLPGGGGERPAAPAPTTPPWQGHQPPFAPNPQRPFDPDDPMGQVISKPPGTTVRVTSAPGVSPTARGPVRSGHQAGSFKVRGSTAVPLGSGAPESSQGSFRVVSDPSHRNGPVRVADSADHNQSARVRTLGVPQVHQQQAPQVVGGQMVPTADLTLWLSVHRRPTRLKPQLMAIRAQTVQPLWTEAFVNPGGIPFDEVTLSTIHTTRPSSNKGPYRRFSEAALSGTRFVAILDDDCVPGKQWLERAMQRIAQMAALGQPCIVACAGTIFRSDDPNSGIPIGPESPRPEEHEVDLGRGGWIMETKLLDHFREREALDDRGWAYHLAMLVQRLAGITMVLPYEQKNHDTWGMTGLPAPENSISAGIEEAAVQGQGFPVAALNATMYQAYRQAGWVPLCVQAVEASAEPVMWQPDEVAEPQGEPTIWNPEDSLPPAEPALPPQEQTA